jgi:hypothetical protein
LSITINCNGWLLRLIVTALPLLPPLSISNIATACQLLLITTVKCSWLLRWNTLDYYGWLLQLIITVLGCYLCRRLLLSTLPQPVNCA